MGADAVFLLFLRLSQYFICRSNLRSPVQTGSGARGLWKYFPKLCGYAPFDQIAFGNVVHPIQQLKVPHYAVFHQLSLQTLGHC